MLDLTLTQSFVNFTNIRWIFSHCGGAFPSIEDRALKLQPAIQEPVQVVYESRYEASIIWAILSQLPGNS